MDRMNHTKQENEFCEDGAYIESLIDRTGVQRRRNRRKTWILLTAVVMAALMAVVSITAFAGSTEETAAASQPAALSLTDTASMENIADSQPAGYILTDVSDVVEEIRPSVVSITSRSLVNYYGNNGFYGGNGGFGDIFDFFFGESYPGRGGYYRESAPEESSDPEEEPKQEEVDTGMGSGTIIGQNSSELLILTSYHVVEGSSSLYVTFVNDANVDGYIKAADADKDIAVVAIPLEDIDADTLGSIKIATISTEKPRMGEGVLVIGNALGYGISVTSGIVSSVDRDITIEGRTMRVIQTDAAINFGNSGGCMVNSRGEVIGISEAKATISYVEGMCYAIPVADNLELIQTLMNAEEEFDPEDAYAHSEGAYLGVRGRDVTSDLADSFGMPIGVYVKNIVPGSGAEEAGVQSGDIIVGVDDIVISSMEELQTTLGRHSAGDVVTLVINRMTDGSYVSMTLDVTLTERIS